MTRDEAIKVFKRGVIGGNWEADWIDKFVALGMLKLDEPKSAADKFRAAMNDLGYKGNSCVWPDLETALNVAGVRIVEK